MEIWHPVVVMGRISKFKKIRYLYIGGDLGDTHNTGDNVLFLISIPTPQRSFSVDFWKTKLTKLQSAHNISFQVYFYRYFCHFSSSYSWLRNTAETYNKRRKKYAKLSKNTDYTFVIQTICDMSKKTIGPIIKRRHDTIPIISVLPIYRDNFDISTIHIDPSLPCSRLSIWALLEVYTRKLSCRKDDRAMRNMYGCHENFRESLTIPTATFPEILMGFCSDWAYKCACKIWISQL